MTESGVSYGFPLTIATLTNVGRVRTNNEDSYGYAWLEDGSLFVIVADGMGGHEAGEVASGLAVQVAEEVVSRSPSSEPAQRLHDALLEANAAILEEGSRSGTRGMGTTAITAVLRGKEATVALIGDSRCYHIRHGQMVWRTLDHTRVQMLVDNGEITDEQARTHPEAGMLTRALGHDRMADGRPLEPDVVSEPLLIEAGDTLLFCSDGLHDLVEDWEIGEMIAGHTPEEAAQLLVDMACERGGHDNVTVAVVCAGNRAGEYNASYVPEGWAQDYGTEDTYSGFESPDNTARAAPAAHTRHIAVAAAAPAAPIGYPNTANTGVLTPEMIAQARAAGGGGSSNKTMIYVAVGVGVLVLLMALLIAGGAAFFYFM